MEAIGIQASGQAGVFGNAINPLQVYMQQNANKQKRLDDQLKDDREQRDALISDLRKFNPDKVWEPFYEEVNEYVQKNVRDFANGALQRGAPVAAIDPYLEKRKGEANTLVNKINWLKKNYQDMGKMIDDDPYLIKKQAHSTLNDHFFNGRQAKRSNEIGDTDQLQSQIFDNPDNYDVNKVVVDFMKSLPTKVTQQWTEYWGQLGKEYNVQETETKLGFQYDAKGDVVLDQRTGQPKISMTDEVFTQALQNPYLKNVVGKYVGDQPQEVQREYLTKILEGQDPRSIKNRPQLGFKFTQQDKWSTGKWTGFSGRVNPERVVERFENNESIVNGFRPDILANTFSPFKDQEVFYVDAKGNEIRSSQNGQYFDKDGKAVGKPTKIRVDFFAKGQAPEAEETDTSGMSEADQAAVQSRDLLANFLGDQKGKRVQKDFDITSETGRRQAHEALNRILDLYLPASNRFGEDYTKLVRDKYEKGSGGVYKSGTKQETGGVY